MHEMYNNLHELCETLEEDLVKMNDRFRKSGGELTGADIEYIDKLTHSIKSVKSTMAMLDHEDEDNGYSNRYYDSGMSYANDKRNGNRGNSYARGRTGNVRRDSMGRYSRADGYSRATEEMADQLRDLMRDAPDETIRKDIQRLLEKVERM